MRVKTVLEDNSSAVLTKYYALGMYEKEVHATAGTRELYYINTPSGISAILESTSSYDSLFYIHTDILGSYDVITDDQGGIRERLSFDPWGRRRNTSSWDYTGVPASFKFDRGFTGHEHLDDFGLINMNGRMYDQILAMFLSPDPFIQSPGETQNFNRYAYALNNPLLFIDPTGNSYEIQDYGWYFEERDRKQNNSYLENMIEMYDDWGFFYRGSWIGPGQGQRLIQSKNMFLTYYSGTLRGSDFEDYTVLINGKRYPTKTFTGKDALKLAMLELGYKWAYSATCLDLGEVKVQVPGTEKWYYKKLLLVIMLES